MIDPALLEQLNNPDPQQRILAIRALVKLDDYAAMEYLKNLYYTDPDPDVREEARLAGLELRGRHNPTGFEGVPRPPMGDPSRYITASEHSVREQQARNESAITWQDTIPYVLVFVVVSIVGVYIMITSTANVIIDMIPELRSELLSDPAFSEFNEAELDALEDALDQSSNVWLILSLILGLMSLLGFVIECYIINHMAISSFRGRGGLYEFIRDFALANAIAWVVFYAFFVVVVQQFGTLIISNDVSSVSSSTGSFLSLAPCGFLIAIIGIVYYLSRVVAKSYNLTLWNGFISLMIGFVSSQVALSMIQFCFSSFIPVG